VSFGAQASGYVYFFNERWAVEGLGMLSKTGENSNLNDLRVQGSSLTRTSRPEPASTVPST
jgi:hypothetical protein